MPASGKVTSRSLSQVACTLTVCSWASHFATPRAMPSMPSVTMNGTTRSFVIIAPLTIPITPPVATAARSASDGGHPAPMPSAVMTPVSAIVAPTDKSIPPLTMIIVIPIAPIAVITVCERTMRRLNAERYRPGSSVRRLKTSDDRDQPQRRSDAHDPAAHHGGCDERSLDAEQRRSAGWLRAGRRHGAEVKCGRPRPAARGRCAGDPV